jgi:RimJ/RimL family protein N-acetyltransferase
VTGPVDRAVEIAYFTFAPHAGRGVATAMARALVDVARWIGAVDVVRAHTLRVEGASTRVLSRLGFDRRFDVDHVEDGPVWRHELVVRA